MRLLILWENSTVLRSCVCVCFRIGDWRIYESVEREHTFTSPFLLPTACHVSCSFAVSYGRSNRSNFVASHLPFGRISRPSVAARIQCPCKANGGPGTAVNYPLYTALALEPILNDPSNLAKERERGRVEEERWETRLPALRQGAPKIHGTTKIARRCQRRRRRGRNWKRRRDARWKPGESFRESCLVFQCSYIACGRLLPLCYSVSWRGQIRIACVLYPRRQMCQNCKCAVRRNTSGGGGSIETGREFRSASSKIYLKTAGWRDGECWHRGPKKTVGTMVWIATET